MDEEEEEGDFGSLDELNNPGLPASFTSMGRYVSYALFICTC
jgi:hypothetical protein